MEPSAKNYDAFLERFTIWAMAQPNVRAAAIIGSRARQQDPADEWSDVDILVVARLPGLYLSDRRWLNELGHVWLAYVDRLPVGAGEECRAMFDGAIEVDFAIVSSQKMRLARFALGVWSRVPAVARLLPWNFRGHVAAMSEILSRGAKALVDKDGLTSALPPLELDVLRSTMPSQEQFLDLTNRFWHGSVWVAKHLRRGELWRAKDGCDVRMKATILHLTEWHAKASSGRWNLDTWALGRFLERWADPRVVAALGDAFARYESEDLWRALFTTMELFRWLARETADKLGLTYRTFAEEHATEWVCRCFSQRHAVQGVGSA
jgi:aminoglycoside 6-adenylyltransferase